MPAYTRTITVNGRKWIESEYIRERIAQWHAEGRPCTQRQLARDVIGALPAFPDGTARSEEGLRYKIGEIIRSGELDLAGVEDEFPFEGLDAVDVLGALRERPRTLAELSELFDRSESTMSEVAGWLVEAGYEIEQLDGEVHVPLVPVPSDVGRPVGGAGTQRFRLGVVSDTHFGSKYEQPTALASFVREAVETYGVEKILHVGDLLDGQNTYRGQAREQYARGIDDQVDAAANRLPQVDGVEWYLLGGNHDYTHYKVSGGDPLRLFVSMRPDVKRLGYDAFDLPLLDGVDARLWHPKGGPAYALSYKPQKYASQLAFDELLSVVFANKPAPTIRFLFVGHFHVRGLFSQGPIASFLVPCFQGQTPYLKAKGLVPYIGGWIVDVEIREAAEWRLTATWLEYTERERDYLLPGNNAREPEVLSVPVFALAEEESEE